MADPSLHALGWTLARDAEFAPYLADGLVPGRLSLEHNHVYRVLTEAGELLAEAAGRIKFEAEGRHELPAVGDWVAIRPDPTGSRALIRAVLRRDGAFSRKAAGRETALQVVAANVDVVFLVFGLDTHVKPRSLERYLVLARRSGARPVIVLNKADVCDDVPAAVTEATLVAGDTPVHAMSTKTGAGTEALLSYIATGRTLAFLGPSGAGKSSLINRLLGDDLQRTGEVREWDNRGRHTSVHRQLLVRPGGGLFIDTPGLRELQLWDTDVVGESFADVQGLADGCRFRDCRHDREPGCAVKAAVDTGSLDPSRYQHYLKLQAEEAAIAKKRDERAAQDAKRQAKVVGRAIKAMYKERSKRGR